MPISVGDTLPEATLMRMGAEGPETVELGSLTKGRKVVIFGLPGAYTGVCTTAHVPSFMRVSEDLAGKGVDEIICVSVNDPFVMQAWGDSTGAAEAGLTFLADPESQFVKSVGLDFTAPPVGLIDRSKRFSMLAEDGKVALLQVEDNPGECSISAGETLLAAL